MSFPLCTEGGEEILEFSEARGNEIFLQILADFSGSERGTHGSHGKVRGKVSIKFQGRAPGSRGGETL